MWVYDSGGSRGSVVDIGARVAGMLWWLSAGIYAVRLPGIRTVIMNLLNS